MNSVRLCFDSNFDCLQDYVLHVMDQIERERFSSRKLYRIRLSVDEALTNAIVHGNGRDSSRRVDVELEQTPESLLIRITDEGEGFDTDTVPEPTEDDLLLQIGGRGVFILSKFADSAEYNECGNSVELRFDSDI